MNPAWTVLAGAFLVCGAVQAQQPSEPVGQAPDRAAQPPVVPALVEMRGVLTPRGSWIVEPSVQYSHSTDNRVALVGFTVIPAITIGLIDVRSIRRDTFIAALAARYGVTNRFELEARVPWVYRDDKTLTRPLATPSVADTAFDADGSGVGDIELAARYQLKEGRGGSPYYVAGLRVKTRTGEDPFDVPIDPVTNLQTRLPTGSGFVGIQPSLLAILPSDPAVFFGSVSYLWNVKRNVGGSFGDVDPGDALGFTAGMGLALNERASFSVGYDHNTVFKTKQDGRVIANSATTQLGLLLLGTSYRVARDKTLNLTLGVGVTEEAPDVQISLRFPIVF
jgi:hypothetical protein